MGLKYALDALTKFKGRNIRLDLTGNGSRIVQKEAGNDNWFAKWVVKPLAGFANWLLSDVFGGLLSWSAVKIWSMIVGGTLFLWNFNWNTPDEQLEASVRNAELLFYESVGETIGVALGWGVCGFLPTLAITKFNSAMGAHILKDVAEESWEEISSELANLIRISTNLIAREWFTKLFIAFRWMIKNAANGSADTLAGGIFEKILNAFPGLKEGAKKWGNKGSKPWILSQKVEEWVESIENPKLEAFLEGLIDEFGDSCIEAGFVVAQGIDEYLASAKLINQTQPLGKNRTIILYPDRENESEKIILAGPQETLKPVITQTLATEQQLSNRDIGMWVGEPLEHAILKQPVEYQIRLLWRNKQKPPYGSAANFKQSQVTIRDVEKTKLDWELIVTLMGGINGYSWGRFKAEAILNNGSTPRLYGGSSDEAKEMLIRLITQLTDVEIEAVNVVEEVKEGRRLKHPSLYKETTRMYPYEMIIFNRDRVINEAEGKASYSGIYKNSQYKIPLYTDQRPANWDEIIQELFRQPGPTF